MARRKGLDRDSIGSHGRVPYMYGTSAMPPGLKPHHMPAVLNQPLYNWWLHEGREQRAQAYAEGLAAVGVTYAPQSTFVRVQREQPEPVVITRGPATEL